MQNEQIKITEQELQELEKAMLEFAKGFAQSLAKAIYTEKANEFTENARAVVNAGFDTLQKNLKNQRVCATEKQYNIGNLLQRHFALGWKCEDLHCIYQQSERPQTWVFKYQDEMYQLIVRKTGHITLNKYNEFIDSFAFFKQTYRGNF